MILRDHGHDHLLGEVLPIVWVLLTAMVPVTSHRARLDQPLRALVDVGMLIHTVLRPDL